jgi:thioredoxin reductase (NADPH)
LSNIIIIGSGPAGVSASLYTVRAGIETKIISKGEGALEKAEKIENYYTGWLEIKQYTSAYGLC